MATKMFRKDQDPDGAVIYWPSGSGSVIWDYGSPDREDPDSKEIFADPQRMVRYVTKTTGYLLELKIFGSFQLLGLSVSEKASCITF